MAYGLTSTLASNYKCCTWLRKGQDFFTCPFTGEKFADIKCDLIGTKSEIELMLVYVWSKVGLSNEFTYLGVEVERAGQWKQQ
jgi:hypothetical protein